MSALRHVLADAPVVLDGGLGTLLDRRGHDVSGALWSASVLQDAPAAVVSAHVAFFRAGARVATTASYQVSREGYRRAGHTEDDADRALETSVRLAREAVDEYASEGGAASPALIVAASVGPYGAMLADGSEYRGDYGLSVAELTAWHRPRIERLWAAGSDILAIETIPSLAEAEAVARALEGTGASAWLSLTVAGGATRSGDPLTEAFALAATCPEIVAVGVNCCAPSEVTPALRAARAVSDKPAVVYPNSGEEWDGKNRRWIGDPGLPAALIEEWVREGAALIGGCCRVGPEDIARMSRVVAGADGSPTGSRSD
jgi:homocysteine S-methyltransferase